MLLSRFHLNGQRLGSLLLSEQNQMQEAFLRQPNVTTIDVWCDVYDHIFKLPTKFMTEKVKARSRPCEKHSKSIHECR